MDNEISAANSIENQRHSFSFLTEIYEVLKWFVNL